MGGGGCSIKGGCGGAAMGQKLKQEKTDNAHTKELFKHMDIDKVEEKRKFSLVLIPLLLKLKKL